MIYSLSHVWNSGPESAFTIRLQCAEEDADFVDDIVCNSNDEPIKTIQKISIRFDLSDLNGFNELTEVSVRIPRTYSELIVNQ